MKSQSSIIKGMLKTCVSGLIFVTTVAVLIWAGCVGPNGNENQNGNPNANGNAAAGSPVITVLSPKLNRDIPAGDIVSLTYTVANVPTHVEAFYDTDTNPNNGRTVIPGTPTGVNNVTVNWDTTGVATGTYYLGIAAENAKGSVTAYATTSSGDFVKITLNGVPVPEFIKPSADVEILITTDSTVDVEFSCNDPENLVNWTLFYTLNDVAGDSDDVFIADGTQNAPEGETTYTIPWQTQNITAVGNYRVGVTCQDSAGSAISVLDTEAYISIVNAYTIPRIDVTEPAEDINAVVPTDVTVEYELSGPDPTGSTIVIWLDTDKTFEDFVPSDDPQNNNREIKLYEVLITEENLGDLGQFTFNTADEALDVLDGDYYVGAYVETGGKNNMDYADGLVKIVNGRTFSITSPAKGKTVLVAPGRPVAITWDTNLPSGTGKIDLSLFNSTSAGAKGTAVSPDPFATDGKNLDLTPNGYTLDTTGLTAGYYVAEGTQTPLDEHGNRVTTDQETSLSGLIRISTLPNMFWVGSIVIPKTGIKPFGHIDGVVFEGFEFEDNAGANFLGVKNVDGLNGDDFIIGARFAKPTLTNPKGIGAGEAYLVYSDPRWNRSNRRFNLNGVGLDYGQANPPSNSLPGLTFVGILFDRDTEDINGDGIVQNGIAIGRKVTVTNMAGVSVQVEGTGCYTENFDPPTKADGCRVRLDFQYDIGNINSNANPFDADIDFRDDRAEETLRGGGFAGVLWLDPDCDGLLGCGSDKSKDCTIPGITTPKHYDNLGPYYVEQFANGWLDACRPENYNVNANCSPSKDSAGFVNVIPGSCISEDRIGDEFLPSSGTTLSCFSNSNSNEAACYPNSVGDATFGLDALGLAPDQDGDGFGEIVFGFPFVDSVKPGRRDLRLELPGLGSLVQPNQFYRGGVVIVPTSNERTVADRTIPGVFGKRDIELDRVGQVFGLEGDEINEGSGIPLPAYRAPSSPVNGMDAYPYIANYMQISGVDECTSDQFAIYVINDTTIDKGENNSNWLRAGEMADFKFITGVITHTPKTETQANVTTCSDDPKFETPVEQHVYASQGGHSSLCLGKPTIPADNTDPSCAAVPGYIETTVELVSVSLFYPEGGGASVAPTAATILAAYNNPTHAGTLYFDSFFVHGPNSDSTYLADLASDPTDYAVFPHEADASTITPGTGSCRETVVGPMFGFYHAMLAEFFYNANLSGGAFGLESPWHPLAFQGTVAEYVLYGPYWDFCATADAPGRPAMAAPFPPYPDVYHGLESISTGFYPGTLEAPFGARILGQADNDSFGTSISNSTQPIGTNKLERILYVSSPMRTPYKSSKTQSGVVYQMRMDQLWDIPGQPGGINTAEVTALEGNVGRPKPHQYIIDDVGYQSPSNGLEGSIEEALNFPIEYLGADSYDGLGAAILGITDFNGDAQYDVVMGAPGADGQKKNASGQPSNTGNHSAPDSGAVYIIYRKNIQEGATVDLSKIALPKTATERLAGMLINGDAGDRMGEVLSGNCNLVNMADITGDTATDDVVIGIPNAVNGPSSAQVKAGEVVIVYGSPNTDEEYLNSPTEGYLIQDLVDKKRALRIQGVHEGDLAGFNVDCTGDFDGDGRKDLAISAPGAKPYYYDPTKGSTIDVLNTPGMDINRNGIVDPELGTPDHVGLVYVILNVQELADNATNGIVSLSQMGNTMRGMVFVGWKGDATGNPGDQLGGGVETKRYTRSRGLAFVGDVDKDGKDDLAIGSILADPNQRSNAGEAYLIYGFTEDDAITYLTVSEE